jgi:predicted alpha/beta-fold hydrolase
MKTVWVWMRNIVIGLLIAFFLLTRGQHLYSLRADSDTQIQKKLAQRNDSVEVTSYTVGERTIRYVDIGDKERPMLILFHGAPGGISTRYNLLKTTSLAQRYRVIILDRPGYGDS